MVEFDDFIYILYTIKLGIVLEKSVLINILNPGVD